MRCYKDTYVGGTGDLDFVIMIALITYGMVVILTKLEFDVAIGVGAPY
jgi:energy-converting hydrogenase Eha subunit C